MAIRQNIQKILYIITDKMCAKSQYSKKSAKTIAKPDFRWYDTDIQKRKT